MSDQQRRRRGRCPECLASLGRALAQMQCDADSVQLRELAGAYGRIRASMVEADVARLAGMLAVQAGIVERGGWTHGPSTLMSVLGLQRAEVANCRVVRWLLDPLSPHGLGAGMLRELGVKLEVDLPNPARAEVEAEVSRGDTRADVVVTGPTWTLVIEAKIDAAEGHLQGARIEHHWQEAQRLLFLTLPGPPSPRTAEDKTRWTALEWGWFADTAVGLLAQTEAISPQAKRAQHALREWIMATRSDLI